MPVSLMGLELAQQKLACPGCLYLIPKGIAQILETHCNLISLVNASEEAE